MKKASLLIAACVFLAAISSVMGQSFAKKISFEDFSQWASGLNFAGYQFMECDAEGDPEYGEKVIYKAVFGNMAAKKMISISFSDMGEFQTYAQMLKSSGKPLIEVGGSRALFMKNGSAAAILLVEKEDIFAAFNMTFSPAVEQGKALDLYKSVDFGAISGGSSAAAAWPREIPQPARINGDVLQVESVSPDVEGYSKQYVATALMNDKLTAELERIQNENGASSLEIIKIGDNIDFTCSNGATIEELKLYIHENEEVRFIYYIK